MARDVDPSKESIRVSLASINDYQRIHEIDTLTNISPWTLEQVESSFKAGHVAIKATINKVLVGFLIYEPIISEAHLLSVAVDPIFQSKGVGRILLKTFLSQAKAQDLDIIYLEVRKSNSIAIAFYYSFGFKTDAIRVAYYTKPKPEDALLMSLAI